MVTIHRIDGTRVEPNTLESSEQVILFPHGLVGCPDWRRFTFEESELPDIYLLASLDDTSICFTLYAIADVDADYLLKLHVDDAESLQVLGVGEPDVTLYCTLTVQDSGAVTANLLGPIVIDHQRGAATQVVLAASSFSTRHPLYAGTKEDTPC